MSTVKANQWLNLDGTENYKCRAWVNFNGTGTVAIRDAGNVSSITDNGVGDYTVNFTTPMSDVNYAVVCTTAANNAATSVVAMGVASVSSSYGEAQLKSTTQVQVTLVSVSGASSYLSNDGVELYVTIFR